VSVGLRHNTGMLGLPDYRGLSMVAFFATCNIVITLLWSAVDHWTLSDPHGGGFYLIVASLGMPLLLPRYRADGKIAAALGTMLAMLIFTRSAAVLCYMITSTGAPLVDATLVRWDDALGFDWVGHGRWLQHHPWLMAALSWSYGSVLPQFVVMTLYLAFTGRYKQLSDFCGVLVLTALICEVVSALVPAAGASKHFAAQLATDISPLSDFEPLRAGTLRSINVGALQGLVSIPSFHTILALLFIAAMRGTWLALPFLLLNLLMLLSTPRFGGHYLVDMIGGVLAYGVAAWGWRLLAARMVVTRRPVSVSHGQQTESLEEVTGSN